MSADMSSFGNGHLIDCPFCEGKGRLKRSELAARLADHEFEAKLTQCRHELQESESLCLKARPTASDAPADFKEEVFQGQSTRILWRRSAKE
jgi:hypothetical protein